MFCSFFFFYCLWAVVAIIRLNSGKYQPPGATILRSSRKRLVMEDFQGEAADYDVGNGDLRLL